MMAVPYQINAREFDVFVILEDENIKRIKEYDPAEIIKKSFPRGYHNLEMRNLIIAYATSEELKEVMECKTGMQMKAIFRKLSRGWKYKPKEGDSDEPYEIL